MVMHPVILKPDPVPDDAVWSTDVELHIETPFGMSIDALRVAIVRLITNHTRLPYQDLNPHLRITCTADVQQELELERVTQPGELDFVDFDMPPGCPDCGATSPNTHGC